MIFEALVAFMIRNYIRYILIDHSEFDLETIRWLHRSIPVITVRELIKLCFSATQELAKRVLLNDSPVTNMNLKIMYHFYYQSQQ